MMACYLFRDARSILYNHGKVTNVTLPYNIPRSGKISETERGNPILSIGAMKERIGIPLARDGGYTRFAQAASDGWEAKAFRLGQGKVFVTTRKAFDVKSKEYDAVIGVDIGAKRLAAVSVIDKHGMILKQLYLGQDTGDRQRDISIRRSGLASFRDKGSRYANQALNRLRAKESNFVKTRSEQVAHEIVELARKHNSFIAIENLSNLYRARGGRKGNRKSKRLPYRKLRAALEAVATQDGRLLVLVNPRDTSRTCSRCDSRGLREKALFRCQKCGYLGNADRNASTNIARRAALQRPFLLGQISARNLSVMAGALVHAGVR